MQVEMIFAIKTVCVQTNAFQGTGWYDKRNKFFIQVKTARISQELIR